MKKLIVLIFVCIPLFAQTKFPDSVGAPTLVFPYDGHESSGQTIMLHWAPKGDVTAYEVKIGFDENFKKFILKRTKEKTLLFENAGHERYFWKVRGFYKELGGSWSDTWTFGFIKNKFRGHKKTQE
jgi:hypothetical protein